MSEFSWDELPEEITVEKQSKKTVIPLSEIPSAIMSLANAAAKDGKFHYQRLPDAEVVKMFASMIAACGQYTTPPTTILAVVGNYTPATSKKAASWEVADRGKYVRYSAGERRGRKTEDVTEGNGDAASE
jgi:hypothetical protein